MMDLRFVRGSIVVFSGIFASSGTRREQSL
jgi:hypothetical protein